jgi:hypothetical protein
MLGGQVITMQVVKTDKGQAAAAMEAAMGRFCGVLRQGPIALRPACHAQSAGQTACLADIWSGW